MTPNWTSRPNAAINPRALVTLLGEWSNGAGPLYRRLADRLRVAVERGELVPGSRLPPERILARALAISRTTVVGAYDELRGEGILESRQGSGTWVAEVDESIAPAPRPGTSPPRHTALRGMMGGAGGTLELLGAHLPCVEDVFATALNACRDDLLELMHESGYFPCGVPALRVAIAHFLTRSGLPTREDQLLVTTGAQQATSLTATSFLHPGDVVVMEDPTYVGAIDAFRTVGARIVTVPAGPDGVSPAALREAVVRHAARLAYLMPNFQNPTGALMPETRRRDIARMAEELQVPVLEDNTLGDIVFGADPPPPIAAFTKDGPVMSVGSMSKLFWAGLRVGWIRAGDAALSRLVQQKVVADMGSSVPGQCVAAHVLAQSDKVRRLRRKQVGHTLDVVMDLVARHLPGWTYTRPQGGLVLWLRMPHGDANELAQVAARHGVSIVPGSWTSPDGGWSDHVRIPLVGEDGFLGDAFERLGRAWLAYGTGTRRPREMGVMV